MLELNPGDNQGIRYVLAAKLLDARRMNELKLLLAMCADEGSADIQYTRALVAYFEDAGDAETIAQIAWETNQYVPGMLPGRTSTIELQGYITMGGQDEASIYVEIFGPPWKRTSGAIDWIENLTSLLVPKECYYGYTLSGQSSGHENMQLHCPFWVICKIMDTLPDWHTQNRHILHQAHTTKVAFGGALFQLTSGPN